MKPQQPNGNGNVRIACLAVVVPSNFKSWGPKGLLARCCWLSSTKKSRTNLLAEGIIGKLVLISGLAEGEVAEHTIEHERSSSTLSTMSMAEEPRP